MNSATSALLALLLVCSLPAMTLVAADPGSGTDSEPDGSLQDETVQRTPVEVNDTTNRLLLTDPVRTSYVTHGPDLGATFASGNDELRIDHERYIVDSRFDDADPDERADLLEREYDRLTDRIEELEERERTAVREHASGERSDAELVRVLLRNHHDATALLTDLEMLEDRTAQVQGFSLSSDEVRSNRASLEFHHSPVRAELVAASRVSQSDEHYDVQVQTTQTGYRLSSLERSTYLTETVRFDNRDPNSGDQFGDHAPNEYPAADYAVELYPWAASQGPPHIVTHGDIYNVWFTLDGLSLDLYFDGGAGEVHRELQEISVGTLPIESNESWSDDGLELTLNETPANGPAEVIVTDSTTGEPVSATITVDEYELGETDRDGSLWILPPADTYELSAEASTGTVNATVPGSDRSH
ncbi:DUF7096 domain-containing protein [Natrarchaeobius chitinivorans]|uniref:Uncharacterized protein n=1 Tax=Natrarchaeobius chitinivorans TaxID=1679083 RepID=A0A3N6LQG0_NATCH|nr:hypothetical protein [Natrarchaeobius chitinivorans]RQG91843.1 hypothetical protein EA473_18825 [Natrarchaeobius chitinivorans]